MHFAVGPSAYTRSRAFFTIIPENKDATLLALKAKSRTLNS